jgi:hypothetical protein
MLLTLSIDVQWSSELRRWAEELEERGRDNL